MVIQSLILTGTLEYDPMFNNPCSIMFLQALLNYIVVYKLFALVKNK